MLVPVGAELVARGGRRNALDIGGVGLPDEQLRRAGEPQPADLVALDGIERHLSDVALARVAAAGAGERVGADGERHECGAGGGKEEACEGMVTGGAVETDPPIVCSDAVEIVSAP